MRTLLSYSPNDAREATVLRERLLLEEDIDLTHEAIGLKPYEPASSFTDSVQRHDAVVHLISLPLLTSKNCMRELLPVMKDDAERNRYRQRTVPIILVRDSDEIDLFETDGQFQLVDYWMGKKTELEKTLDARGRDLGLALDEIRGDLSLFREITEQVVRFVRTVTDSLYAASYTMQAEEGFAAVIARLRQIDEEAVDQAQGAPASSAEGLGLVARMRQLRGGSTQVSSPLAYPVEPEDKPSPEVRHLMELSDSIVIASEDNPDKPEFPPFSPRFPATPAYRIPVERLGRQIWIKDESHNLTGSHKDRMAWEIVVYYKKLIEDLLSPHAKPTATLPSASIISNGSAALAIQVMLRCYGLPALKVLLDDGTDEKIVKRLERAGCEVVVCDLGERELDSEDVLRLTKNEGGFDVTARKLVDPARRTYYDWLAYEILNCGAKHIFIPVGTGDLFVNVLTVLHDELTDVANDPRLLGGVGSIEGLELYGATSSDWKTKMNKLYAKYRPTLGEAHRVVDEMRERGLCGERSRIYDVDERFVREALRIAHSAGVRCDESGIAGLSLLLQLSEEHELPPHEEILVVNTGWLYLG